MQKENIELNEGENEKCKWFVIFRICCYLKWFTHMQENNITKQMNT